MYLMEIINVQHQRTFNIIDDIRQQLNNKLHEMLELVNMNSNLYQVWDNWLNIRYKATIIYIMVEEIKNRINPKAESCDIIKSLIDYSHSSNVLQYNIKEIIERSLCTNQNFTIHVNQYIKHFAEHNPPPYASFTLSLNMINPKIDIREVSNSESYDIIMYTVFITEMIERWIDTLMILRIQYFT